MSDQVQMAAAGTEGRISFVSSILAEAAKKSHSENHVDETSSTHHLRPETKKFLHTLHKYLDCRNQMDAKYQEIDEFETIAKFSLEADSGGIETSSEDPLEFKEEYQQQTAEGNPVKTLNELYDAADVAFPIYQTMIKNIVDKVCQVCGVEDRDSIYLTFAPLKGRDRAKEKAEDDYAKRNPDPGVSWLFDIVRGSVEFTSAEQIMTCLKLMKDDPSIHIVKAKNRFHTPSLSGYRDLNLHIQIQVNSSFQHICEIQMHHQAIKTLEKKLQSHDYYEYFRSYFAGATDSLEERLADLKHISEGGALDDSLLNDLLEKSEDEERLVRLGKLFWHQLCEYHWALRVYGRLVEVQLERYGEEHNSLGETYHSVGMVLQKRGNFKDAMKVFERSAEIKKASLGNDHPSVAECYNDVANVLQKQGNYDKAIEVYEESLEITKNYYGEESSPVAQVYSGMSVVFRKQNNFDKALELLTRSVEIHKKTIGEENGAVAFAYNGMAWILKHNGDLDGAMALYHKSFEISKKKFGDTHSSLAFTYNGMAGILEKQGKLDEALDVYNKSMEICRKSHGGQHSSVTFAFHKICKIQKKQGKIEEAN